MASQDDAKDTPNKDAVEMSKMRQQLAETGCYEEGMTLAEMRSVINILNESREMHESMNSQNSQTPDLSPRNSTENNNESPKKSYANLLKKSPSPENVNTADDNAEKKNAIESKCESNSFETNQSLKFFKEQSKKAQRRMKLTMDPFEASVPGKDQPLNRPINDCGSPDYWNDFNVPIKERIEQMSNILLQVRDEWITDYVQVANDSELEWGSPIEVASRIFSLDRKTTKKIEAEPMRESSNRASKRKASSLIASHNNNSDSEPEADDETGLLKKRKPQQERRNLDESGNNVPMDVDIEQVPNIQTPSTSYSTFRTSNERKIEDSDEEDIFEVKPKKSTEIYPRVITPPIPCNNKARRGRGKSAKTNYKGPRAKKNEKNDNTSKNNEVEEISTKASAPEIILDCDTSELHDISPQTDIKMLKMPLAERTRFAKQRLKDLENKDKEKIEEKKLNEQKLEEEKKKKQEELVKKRLAEKEETMKLAKEKEEHDKEMQKKWNTVLHEKVKAKDKQIKDRKNMSEEEIRQNIEGDDEEDILICDDVPAVPSTSSSSSSKNKVECPICNKFFPGSDIENHASECNQFEVEERSSPVVGKRQKRGNKADMKICHSCREFETCNESDYLEHVQICVEEHRNRRDSKLSSNQSDFQGSFSSERKNFNLRKRPN